MSTSPETLLVLEDCLSMVPDITFRRMMGEYCVYSRGKIFGLVCNNTLFLKITTDTIHLFEDQVTKAYPGSKHTAPVNVDWLEDRERLAEVVALTLESLMKKK